MSNSKTRSSVKITRSLQPAENAVNEATIGVLAVGTEVLRARTFGGFGAMEGQEAVDQIGRATNMLFSAMSEIAAAHTSLRDIAADHEILNYGDLCPPPSAESKPHLREVKKEAAA